MGQTPSLLYHRLFSLLIRSDRHHALYTRVFPLPLPWLYAACSLALLRYLGRVHSFKARRRPPLHQSNMHTAARPPPTRVDPTSTTPNRPGCIQSIDQSTDPSHHIRRPARPSIHPSIHPSIQLHPSIHQNSASMPRQKTPHTQLHPSVHQKSGPVLRVRSIQRHAHPSTSVHPSIHQKSAPVSKV